MKHRLFFALLLLTATFIGTDAFAQKKYLAIVHSNTGNRYSGVITEATAKNFTLRMRGGQLRTFAADTVETVKVRTKNALNNNMLFGVTAGLAAGGLVYNNQHNKGNVTTIVLPALIVSSIVSGAGFGGFFNSFFAKEKFTDVAANYSQIHQKLGAYAVPVTNDDKSATKTGLSVQ